MNNVRIWEEDLQGWDARKKNENMGTFFRKGVSLREYMGGKEKLTSLKGKKK